MSSPYAIIPVYQPQVALLRLVNNLSRFDYQRIIIVNDGSSADRAWLFEKLLHQEQERLVLLEHTSNFGKGAALKTAFRYIVEQNIETLGAVTLDGDGQHLVGDVLKVTRGLFHNPESLSLGVRTFNSSVPLRSLIGNYLMGRLFSLSFNKKLADTQTGLRAIPARFLAELIQLESDQYDFELEMLSLAVAQQIDIVEIPIETVYKSGNSQSHFRPVLDSLRIARLMLRLLCNKNLSSGVQLIR